MSTENNNSGSNRRISSEVIRARNYERALARFKERLEEPVPHDEADTYSDPLDFLKDSLCTYYGEQRLPLYTAFGKEAESAEEKLHEKLRQHPGLQEVGGDQKHRSLPDCERIIEDMNQVISCFEEVALVEGVKIGMRLMMDAMEV